MSSYSVGDAVWVEIGGHWLRAKVKEVNKHNQYTLERVYDSHTELDEQCDAGWVGHWLRIDGQALRARKLSISSAPTADT